MKMNRPGMLVDVPEAAELLGVPDRKTVYKYAQHMPREVRLKIGRRLFFKRGLLLKYLGADDNGNGNGTGQ